jgi:hypothetical protein
MEFTTEKDFEAYYYGLTDPIAQVRALNDWRRHQIRIVSKFVEQIRLVADEQYTDVDHFILELLQNADDNEYAQNVTPHVAITLDRNRLVVDNNERGFTPENVYAITYAAASTKLRAKSASTFIGEKGIGFKSVFAVADHVDVHSGPYHFRLKNGEFIVPHLLTAASVTGTRIVLSLKRELPELPKLLSTRMRDVAAGAQEFLLFLQKIRHVVIRDNVGGYEVKIRANKDGEDRYVIAHGNARRAYIRRAYDEVIPRDIAMSRYPSVSGDLPRQIVFAVPVPDRDAPLPQDGKLFCFLPTHIRTGLPMHVQADAKTTTNRENILAFASSAWNRALLQRFAEHMTECILDLRESAELRMRLPELWPVGAAELDITNEDLKRLLVDCESALHEKPVVLDRHGTFRPPSEVRLIPKEWLLWLDEDKYELGVAKHLRTNISFVHPVWSDAYRARLSAIGVTELDAEEISAALLCGVPTGLEKASRARQQEFLEVILEFGNKHWNARRMLKNCPVFPLYVKGSKAWGELAVDVFWVPADSPKVEGVGSAKLVDPEFTYSPGGRSSTTRAGERIRHFNARFRSFLEATLQVPRFGEIEFVRRTLFSELAAFEGDPNDQEIRRRLNKLWAQVFNRVWRRRRTLSRDAGGEFDSLITDLADCPILARPLGKKEWVLVPVQQGFLGKPFLPDSRVESLYADTAAPLITLDEALGNAKNKAKIKAHTDAWAEFLKGLSANTGPYCARVNFKELGVSGWRAIGDSNEEFATFLRAVDQAVSQHPEFAAERPSSYSLGDDGDTVALDRYSMQALMSQRGHADVLRSLGGDWTSIKTWETEVRFVWGQKWNSRHVTSPYLGLYDQIKKSLKLETPTGLFPPTACFFDTSFNRSILNGLRPTITSGRDAIPDELLELLGVQREITVATLADLVESWYGNSDSAMRTVISFRPYLEMLARYLEARPEHAPQFQLRIRLFDPLAGGLLRVADWIQVACERGYPQELVERIGKASRRPADSNPDELVGALFELSDLAEHTDEFFTCISELGDLVEKGRSVEVLESFDRRLKEQGILAFEKVCRSRRELPFAWIVVPAPLKPAGMLVARDAHRTSRTAAVLKLIDWPSTATTQFRIESSSDYANLGEIQARRAYLSVKDVFERLRAAGHRIDMTAGLERLTSGVASILDFVRVSDSIRIRALSSSNNNHIEVPWWPTSDMFLIRHDVAIERVIPRYIDQEIGLASTPFFDLVWAKFEAEAHVTEGEGNISTSEPPAHPEAAKTNEAKARIDEEERKTKDQNAFSPRRRLCSLVLPSENRAKVTVDTSAQDDEVEQKGRERFLSYVKSLGVEALSRERDRIGYDFEIHIGGRRICIELKASKDQWNGWEHALTSKEFKTALEIGDDYFLCAVDGVFDHDFQIYFIRNPARLVDQFLYDHPWRHLAEDIGDYIHRLKIEATEPRLG